MPTSRHLRSPCRSLSRRRGSASALTIEFDYSYDDGATRLTDGQKPVLSSIAAEFGARLTDTSMPRPIDRCPSTIPVSRPYRSPMWSPSATSRSRRTRFASSSRPPTLPPRQQHAWCGRPRRRHRERSRRVECRGQRLRTLGWADFVRHHDHLVCGRRRVHLRALQRLRLLFRRGP